MKTAYIMDVFFSGFIVSDNENVEVYFSTKSPEYLNTMKHIHTHTSNPTLILTHRQE